MWEEGEYHRNMMKLHEENQRREREAYDEKRRLRNYTQNYTQNNSGTSNSNKKKGGLLSGIIGSCLFGIICYLIYLFLTYTKIAIAILILICLLVIVYFIFRKKNNETLNYIGKDSKGRPVFESRNLNGTSSMCKMVENGKLEMGISDFEADSGKSHFKPSENLRRILVALEKGLVQEKDKNGKIIFKDSLGNYIDNPDDYTGFTGKGKETLSNGDVYEGDFVNGNRHGKGKITSADGSVYEGDFFDGIFHGKGKFTSADGFCYEGDFFDEYFQGKGKMTWSDGVYEGDFFEDKFHGKGKITWTGGVYEGDFVNGKYHGKGKFTSADGTVKEGDFKEGVFLE